MPSSPDKPKRWRPRWSVRTLAVVVTLVCAYFGSWPWLESQALRDVDGAATRACNTYFERNETTFSQMGVIYSGFQTMLPDSTAPYVVCVHEATLHKASGTWRWRRRYYAWMFGPTLRLPFTETLPNMPTASQRYYHPSDPVR